ncbi:hypothetical protein RUND412_005084 [Rhizina undulata]
MPKFDDINRLPCVRAVVKEVLRWRLVTAGADIPHQLLNQFQTLYPELANNPLKGYISTEISPSNRARKPLIAAVGPALARPLLDTYPHLQNFSAFGFGRRICPGMNISERSLNLLTARILWACHMAKKNNVSGREVEVPPYDYTAGFNIQPKKFEFVLTEREGRGEYVRRLWEGAWDKEWVRGLR